MKTIILGLLLSISAYGWAQQHDFTGYWEIYKIESLENKSTFNDRSQFIVFESNGIFKGGRIEEQLHELEGTWKWDDANATIEMHQELTDESGHDDDGIYKVEFLENKTIKLTNERSIVYLEKKEK